MKQPVGVCSQGELSDHQKSCIRNLAAIIGITDHDELVELLSKNSWDALQAEAAYYAIQVEESIDTKLAATKTIDEK